MPGRTDRLTAPFSGKMGATLETIDPEDGTATVIRRFQSLHQQCRQGTYTMGQEREVMNMAGYFTAQALVDASYGDIFRPVIGYLNADGIRRMEHLSEGTFDEAVRLAEEKIESLDDGMRGAILIKDGVATFDAGKTDCLIMDIRFSADKHKRVQYLQAYRNTHHSEGFAIYPLRFTEIEGFSTNQTHLLIQALFDGMDSHREGSLLKERHYLEHMPDQPPRYNAAGSHFNDYGLTPDEYARLQLAPVLVFSVMGRVHGSLDVRKYEAFGKMLYNAGQCDSPLFEKIAFATINNIESLMISQMQRDQNVFEDMNDIRRIADSRLPVKDAIGFKKALLQLGNEIAKASGGFFWPRGILTRKQRKVLQGLAQYLEIA